MGDWTSKMFLRQIRQSLLAAGAVLTGLSCGGSDVTAPTTGNLEITTATTGPEPDADGYAVSIDEGAEAGIGLNGTLRRDNLEPGSHTVRLLGMAANCTVAGDNPRIVSISAGATGTVEFNVTCGPTTGGIIVNASTSGPAPDADGYTVTVDGTDRGTLTTGGGINIDGLTPGDHLVGLSGVAANCQTEGNNPSLVTVMAGASATVVFAITCATPPPNVGTISITTATTGTDLDPNGYAFAVDGGASQPIGTGATAILTNVAAGNRSVELSGVAGNCAVQGTNPRSVTVSGAATTDVSFAITCTVVSGAIRVSVTTSGSPIDPDGYVAKLDGGEPGQSIATGGSANFPGVQAGTHTVTLTGVATNCAVNDGPSRSVTLTGGATADVSFAVICTASTGSLEISTTTPGGSPDPDGYMVSVDGGSPQGIGTNSSLTLASVAPGVHTLALTGVAANCTVDGESSRTVTVAAGQQATVSFAIRCSAITSGTYQGIDLGALDGGESSEAKSINPAGQVVGFSFTAAGIGRAFLWENGVMTDLGTLGGAYSRASGINATGQAAGDADLATGGTHAALWDRGIVRDLGTLGGSYSIAYGINDAAQVVGLSVTAGGSGHAFLWDKGIMTDLGTLGGRTSTAYAINNLGQVVGGSETADGVHRAFLWQNGVMTDLGTLGGCCSVAQDINDDGQIVGHNWIFRLGGEEDPGETHAFLWEKGTMTGLGTLGGIQSTAISINSEGQIVGESERADGRRHATLWQDGVITDLGTLAGGETSWATGINPAGQVVGVSQAETRPGFFALRATLWTRK